jgi:hypothetical protein
LTELRHGWWCRTDQKIGYGFFVGGPLFGADAGLERRVDGFEIDAGRYQLAGLGGFVY